MMRGKEFDCSLPATEILNGLKQITGGYGKAFCWMYDPRSGSKYWDNGKNPNDPFKSWHQKWEDCWDENCINSEKYILPAERDIPLFKKSKLRRLRLE